MLEDTDLSDLEWYGHPYTWECGRNTKVWMEIRLDRAMVNRPWGLLFPLVKLYNLKGSSSDHSPIFLDVGSNQAVKQKRSFKSENAWLLEPQCVQIVQSSWEEDASLNIIQKVRHCGENLDHRGRKITGCLLG